jgi:hypothetical protein
MSSDRICCQRTAGMDKIFQIQVSVVDVFRRSRANVDGTPTWQQCLKHWRGLEWLLALLRYLWHREQYCKYCRKTRTFKQKNLKHKELVIKKLIYTKLKVVKVRIPLNYNAFQAWIFKSQFSRESTAGVESAEENLKRFEEPQTGKGTRLNTRRAAPGSQ